MEYRGCVTPKVIGNLNELLGEGEDRDIDMLDGYEDLPSELQEKIVRALDNGHVDAEDWKGVSLDFSLFLCSKVREETNNIGS